MKDIHIEPAGWGGDDNPAHADTLSDTAVIYGPFCWFGFPDQEWIPEFICSILAHEQTHLTLHHLFRKAESARAGRQRVWARLDDIRTSKYTGIPEDEMNVWGDPSGFDEAFVKRLEKNYFNSRSSTRRRSRRRQGSAKKERPLSLSQHMNT